MHLIKHWVKFLNTSVHYICLFIWNIFHFIYTPILEISFELKNTLWCMQISQVIKGIGWWGTGKFCMSEGERIRQNTIFCMRPRYIFIPTSKAKKLYYKIVMVIFNKTTMSRLKAQYIFTAALIVNRFLLILLLILTYF